MRKIIGTLFVIADLMILPMLLVYYILLTVDLLYGCATSKGNFNKEFADFNKVVIDNINERIQTHKDRILGD